MSEKSDKIDKIDAKIVSLLSEDGRMSCADISRRIGDVSERTVRYRIKRLIDGGIIRILPVVNPASLGYVVIADVFIEVEPAFIQEVAHKLASIECVTYVAFSIGERDVSIQIAARTNSDVYEFVTGTVAKLPGVRKTTTSIVPHVLKDLYTWPVPVEAIR
ncbi:MAG: Lrp/AsnC family transcriptional regulator [Chloroflexi bacterium]|nr:MAG: Lrp/AsnC family transcriptional regulator [Chloroflexota bacterium]